MNKCPPVSNQAWYLYMYHAFIVARSVIPLHKFDLDLIFKFTMVSAIFRVWNLARIVIWKFLSWKSMEFHVTNQHFWCLSKCHHQIKHADICSQGLLPVPVLCWCNPILSCQVQSSIFLTTSNNALKFYEPLISLAMRSCLLLRCRISKPFHVLSVWPWRNFLCYRSWTDFSCLKIQTVVLMFGGLSSQT